MAGKGGGAWKVAYADFVTAMMAFFLVMWICGQDQKIKRAVSYYFTDPFGASSFGTSRKPSRTGNISEMNNAGPLPQSEAIALGHGRNSYQAREDFSICTKMISDWMHSKPEVYKYWQDQAAKQRAIAKRSGVKNSEEIEKMAVQGLAKQFKAEMWRDIPDMKQNLFRDLLMETLAGVNWNELAEDILEH